MGKFVFCRIVVFVVLLFQAFNGYAQCPSGSSLVSVQLLTNDFPEEKHWNIYVDNTIATADYLGNPIPNPIVGEATYSICVPDGASISIEGCDTADNGWDGTDVILTLVEDGSVNGCTALSGCILTSVRNLDNQIFDCSVSTVALSYRMVSCGNHPILGCSDPTSNNYNPCATVNDGSCIIEASPDECTDAIELIPNTSQVCTGYVIANTGSATQSLPGCTGTADDDIWFSFTATQPNHIIDVDVTSFFGQNYVIQVIDSCGGNELLCRSTFDSVTELNDLNPGSTYYFRVYTASWLFSATMRVCVTSPKLPVSCEVKTDIHPVCSGEPLSFEAGVNQESASVTNPLVNYDCLSTTPNPAWFYFEVEEDGDIDITLTNTLDVDVDGAIWGPFNSISDINLNCANGSNAFQQPLDCDYRTDADAPLFVSDVSAGEIYVILATNYENVLTEIILDEGTTMTAMTDCYICPSEPLMSVNQEILCGTGDVIITPSFGTEGLQDVGTFDISVDNDVGVRTNIADGGFATFTLPLNETCDPIIYTFTAVANCSDGTIIPELQAGDLITQVTVLPNLTNELIELTGNNGCSPFINSSCSNLLITNDYDSSGANPDLSGETSNGQITFSVSHPDNNQLCLPLSITATYNCSSQCPDAAIVSDGSNAVCDGSLTSEIIDWQTQISISNSLDTTQDPGDLGQIVYSSIVPDALQGIFPDGILPDGIHTGTDKCEAETQIVGAYLYCDTDANGTVSSADSYSLVSTYTLTVYPNAFIDDTPIIDGCTTTISMSCPNNVMNAINATGGASLANFDPATGVYTAQSGNSAGVVEIEVINQYGCPLSYPLSTPDCLVLCPDVTEVNETSEVCNGGLTTELSDWQSSIESTNTVAIGDDNIGLLLFSSLQVPSSIQIPNGIMADGIHSEVDVCIAEEQITYAYLHCFGADGLAETGDDEWLLVGNHILTVNPSTQLPPTELLADGCQSSVSAVCPSDVLSIANEPNIIGGASIANFDSTTGIYTAQPGDQIGAINIAITNQFGCGTEIYTLITPSCPALCPLTTPIDQTLTLCDGTLTSEITDWQTSIVSNPDNATAVANTNTGVVVYSSTAVDSNNPADGILANGIHSAVDICLVEEQRVYAYLQCYGADATADTPDDQWLQLGTFLLSVEPSTQLPTNINVSDCSVTIDLVCTDDVVVTVTNPTGGASTVKFDSTTGVYTAQPGDQIGSIDIEIVNQFGCDTEIYKLVTPSCPALCPLTTPIDQTLTVCDRSLTSEITDWQTTITNNQDNAIAIADGNTASIVYSSNTVDATNAADGFVASGIHSGSDACVVEEQLTYAYLQCFGDDGIANTVDDQWLRLGTLILIIEPSTQVPTSTIDDCMVTLDLACANDLVVSVTNPTGDAKTDNFIVESLTYISDLGNKSGSIDLQVSNQFGCNSFTYTLNTPECIICPQVGTLSGLTQVCKGDSLQFMLDNFSNLSLASNGIDDYYVELVHFGADNPLPVDITSGGDAFAVLDTANLTSTVSYPTSNMESGIYQVCARLQQSTLPDDCLEINQSDCIEVQISDVPSFDLSDVTIEEGDDVELTDIVIANNPEFYTSEEDALVTANALESTFLMSPESQTIYVVDTNQEGCSIMDSFEINIQELNCKVFVPNIFSPNSVENSKWAVQSNCGLSDYSLSIVDRWGNLVFQSSSPDDVWHGMFNGKKCEIGVYVYLLEFTYQHPSKNEVIRQSGDITLIR